MSTPTTELGLVPVSDSKPKVDAHQIARLRHDVGMAERLARRQRMLLDSTVERLGRLRHELHAAEVTQAEATPACEF